MARKRTEPTELNARRCNKYAKSLCADRGWYPKRIFKIGDGVYVVYCRVHDCPDEVAVFVVIDGSIHFRDDGDDYLGETLRLAMINDLVTKAWGPTISPKAWAFFFGRQRKTDLIGHPANAIEVGKKLLVHVDGREVRWLGAPETIHVEGLNKV